MKITICSSMTFAKEMIEIQNKLTEGGHEAFLPEDTEVYASGIEKVGTSSESTQKKMENDYIRKHVDKIRESEAILVLNKTKNGVENYIGGNSFLEIGFAYIFDKKVFLWNPVPEMPYSSEILAMNPVILNGGISKIS